VIVSSHKHPKLPDLTYHDGSPVHRFDAVEALQKNDLRGIKLISNRLAALKKEFKPDLVHIVYGPIAFFHESSRSASTAKSLVMLALTPELRDGRESFARRILTSADWIATVSEATLTVLRQLVPETEGRSSAILNALELPSLEPAPLEFDPPRLLAIGRLVPEKGFDLTLEALALLIARFPRIRLMIAGDGPERPLLEEKARTLNVAGAVHFMGWVPPEEIPRLINRASMVLMSPRWQEAFGLVALQAAQMGRPIVATRVGGLAEVVADHETGLLVEKENPRALADAAAFLLEHPETAMRIGHAARTRAVELFSLEKCVDQYDALYQRLGAES
jgi:glycogen(starch) synthase